MAENIDFQHTNELIHESSPYLQQHAHNPVNWLPWGEKARIKALAENKPMLISIGYSACHWCHVMEKESFENEDVAALMNAHFICIKVDREERPDVDQVYMEAVQMMRKQGGWPLNCFTTPDGKPVYGGTYFPKANWIQILQQLSRLWETDAPKFTEYGDQIVSGMHTTGGLPVLDSPKEFSFGTLREAVKNWIPRMDNTYGGPDKAPKFPLPVNYLFLLHYGALSGNNEVLSHVEITLDKLALGGIFDQIGGGFARYSTDIYWKVPHFEKMLYDNAQLLSLFSEGYKYFQKADYLRVVNQISEWLNAEMQNGHGGYYSALDADSEGEEGKYYTFEISDLREKGLLESFEKFYFTDQHALWEGKLIAVRKQMLEDVAVDFQMTTAAAKEELDNLNRELAKIQKSRVRPGTDDKTICSWNAMMAEGFLTAYESTGDDEFLLNADRIFNFIEKELYDSENEKLSHSWKNGKSGGVGFLEDYAFLIAAWLKKVEINFDETTLDKARTMANKVLDAFYDAEKGLFYMTSSDQKDLISRPVEMSDNVIPSGNSVMAQNLHKLASFYGNTHFANIADRILQSVEKSMIGYPEGYGHFADLYLRKAMGAPEIVITGSEALQYKKDLKEKYLPNFLWAVSYKGDDLPIFANRFEEDKTQVFVCQNKTCQLPVDTIEKAEDQIENTKKNFDF